MKAIFGKLSILWSLLIVVSFFIPFFFGVTDGRAVWLMVLVSPILFTPVGFLCCYFSAGKKEIPKYYRYIGFSLNFLSLFPSFYILVCSLYKNLCKSV